MSEHFDGVFVWIQYSETTGSIRKALRRNPKSVIPKIYTPNGYKWSAFITNEKSLDQIYNYRVTKSGLEKKINRYLVTK